MTMARDRQAAADGDGGGPGRDDTEIIVQSWQDPDRFAVLFRRHAPALTRYAERRLGAGPADDIVAETFLVAFRQRKGYDTARRDARPWLYGIATNLIGRYRRSEVRQYRALARTGLDPVTESFTDRVDAAVSAGSAARRLAAALARLPAGHRDVLLLVAWGGLSYDETALALGVPVGTVRSRLSRARRSVRRSFGDADPLAACEPAAPQPMAGIAGSRRAGPPPAVPAGCPNQSREGDGS